MPVIYPVSDLRNNTPKIENICIKEQQPVYITKNGVGHLVVMSLQLYEQQQALLELYEKLDEAEEQEAHGLQCKSHREVMSQLRSRING